MGATSTSGRTCTPTPSCLVAPPCTWVSPTGCRRRSPPLPPPPSRSRSLLLPRGSTPSGSVAPSWPPSPPSSRCGSPSRSTTSVAPPLSTASASRSPAALLHSKLFDRSLIIQFYSNPGVIFHHSLLKFVSNKITIQFLENAGG